jgi:23S rRNA maturation mini-RNase III
MNRSPDQLPDPWLFDSEALLRELDRCRELILQIPITNPNATHFGINIALDAIWNLSVNLRYLLHLHREEQRAIRRQHEESLSATLARNNAATKHQIVNLHTPAPSNGKKRYNNTNRTHSPRERFAERRKSSGIA